MAPKNNPCGVSTVQKQNYCKLVPRVWPKLVPRVLPQCVVFAWQPVPVYPGPEDLLGLANAKWEKTREEKGKTSGEFVSDSWFG